MTLIIGVTLDRLAIDVTTWRPYMEIDSWLEELRHIPYMNTRGYIIGR